MTVEETNENQELEVTPTVDAVAAEPEIAPVATSEVEAEEEDVDLDDIIVDTTPVGSAHDDFDWARDKRGRILYSLDQSKQLFEQYESSMKSLNAGEIVKGRVSALTGSDVVLDINYKSDGLVALSDFRDIPDLKVGDFVEIYVESQEDAKGQLQLSRR
jgi:small subunit ribosomal protein S1